ncbi:MAG: MOSC domain-containing protein [Hyphomicrobiaceae bacterium]
MKTRIDAVLTGKARPFRGDEASAIGKLPIEGFVAVGPLGLAGDEQADRVHHGGLDKAVHHYPADHYPFWRDALGAHALLDRPGAFGENVSTAGMTENDICLGDRLRLGTALVEVSQARQPCWKLNHRFANKDAMERVIASGNSGWYYRVLEPGRLREGDDLALVDRPFPQWTVVRVFALIIGGLARTCPDDLRRLGDVPALSENWQARVAKLISQHD